MKHVSTFLPVTLAGVLFAAMVIASPTTPGAESDPAKAPNRAEAFVVAMCGTAGGGHAAQAQGWHSALASKRAYDRAITLASGNPDLAKACDTASQ